MADIWSGQTGNSWCPQIHMGWWLASYTDTTDTFEWYADYVAHGYAAYTNGKARSWSINIDGQVRSGSFNINGQTGTVRLGSGQITVSKTHAYRNIGVSCSMYMDFTWNGSYLGTASASGSNGVGAKTSYAVSYNANGGSGAPGNQTKWHGENLALSGTRPTRTGHNFAGWATSASGAVAYQPGSTYTGNGNLTLYAKWTPHTYTVSYNANGGSGAPGNQTKTYGVNLTLSGTKPTRTNYNFKGWGTSSSSTTASYQPGSTYTDNSAITLYAIWELAWLEPRITNLQATRCDSAGSLKEDGTYAKVSFNWATDRGVQDVHVVCNGKTYANWASGGPVVGQMSGSPTIVIGDNGLSTENQYAVDVRVVDTVGGVTISTVIAPMAYIMDISPNGGIGFGKPALNEKSIKSALNFYVNKSNGAETQIHASSPAGSIYLYAQGSTTGYRGIYGFNAAGNGLTILTANSNNEVFVAGERVTHAKNINGYWGVQLPNGTDTDWYRTTYDGIIPYQSGGASALGTDSWPFNRVWTNELNWTGNGLKGRVMKQIWSGNLSINGSTTVSELPYYNIFVCSFDPKYTEYGIGIRSPGSTVLRFFSVNYINSSTEYVTSLTFSASGTTLTMTGNLMVNLIGNKAELPNSAGFYRLWGVL